MSSRIRTIRRRVAAITVATFLLAVNVIGWTGSMGTSTSTAATTTTAQSTDQPAAVTTGQS
jgi:hypothetical protein